MNEGEKQAIKKFENLLIKHFEDKKIDKVDYMDYFEGATILNLIEKQQKEIEELNLDLEEMTKSNNHKKEYWVHKSILNSYVSKDKIKEQIRMVEETKRKGKGIDNYSMHYCIMRLKELLGE